MGQRPTVAITMGDPAGIGPEIALKAALEERVRSRCRPVIVGSLSVLEHVAKSLEIPCRLTPWASSGGAVEKASDGNGLSDGMTSVGAQAFHDSARTIEIVDLANCRPEQFEMGRVSPLCGRASADYIEKAVAMTLSGIAAAVVTAPIHKESLHLAGVNAPGHTEMLAQLTGAKEYAMMLVAGGLRVSHVTTHIALKDVPGRITTARVYSVIRLTHDAVQAMGVDSPRIGVAGLNPHGGEGGLFGKEELEQIIPAVQRARHDGITVDGPVPADTVFVKARAGQYDAVVAMYHDQGHIPVKLAGFHVDPRSGTWSAVEGVNVTLGLPIIRTSVDHGVAFDIAGKGVASWQSMVDAIDLAVDMARRKP